MLAYCGLECDTCPIYLATLEKDKKRQRSLREEIAKLCVEQYGMDLLPGDINDCDGCKAESGRLFSGCKKCGIRICAVSKNLENCAFCEDYPCIILNDHFKMDPGAEIRLDGIYKMRKA